jgi:hypothetical protein
MINCTGTVSQTEHLYIKAEDLTCLARKSMQKLDHPEDCEVFVQIILEYPEFNVMNYLGALITLGFLVLLIWFGRQYSNAALISVPEGEAKKDFGPDDVEFRGVGQFDEDAAAEEVSDEH